MAKATTSMPTVSVLMAVYNGDKYLRPAITSILDQTYRDLEFIVADDGSTDDTAAILREFDDPRLIVIHHDNIGLTRSLNRLIELARGRYIARQDSDDISVANRLAQQVEFLDRHRDTGLVGTWGEQIDADGTSIGILRRATTHPDIKHNLPNENEFLHGSIMVRTEVLKEIGQYRPYFILSQDYDLVLRLVHANKLANIPAPLYKKRHIPDTLSIKNIGRQKYYSKLAQALYRERLAIERDSLDRGASLDGLVDDDDQVLDATYYERNTIYLYFRSDNYKKARAEIKKVIKKYPWRVKSYVQYVVTFLGPGVVKTIVRLRDRLNGSH